MANRPILHLPVPKDSNDTGSPCFDTKASIMNSSTVIRYIAPSVREAATEAANWARERGGPLVGRLLEHQDDCNYLLFATECSCRYREHNQNEPAYVGLRRGETKRVFLPDALAHEDKKVLSEQDDTLIALKL